MSDKPANSIPKQFGRYRIEKPLGAGGMGAVYLAHDSQLDRNVAIKTPKFNDKSSKNLIKRFYREARSAATLQHPNICPVYDVGEIGGIHYISMAYIEGRPLSDSMKSKTFPPVANVIRVIRKVALALHEAHTQGLVHRDLKPANIMIDRRGEPIVMDFGLARQFGTDELDEPIAMEGGEIPSGTRIEARLTMEGTVVGSPGYMSPEQLHGDPALIGPPCDVYALGVLLYELLTRQLPFPGDGTLTSVIKAVLSEPTPNPSTVRPQIEPRFDVLCQKAMAKKVTDRYDSMQSFAIALTNALKSGDASGPTNGSAGFSAVPSPELVRTKEQFELARSLYQEGQFAGAASIMEKMVAGGKQNPNQYTSWAEEKLPKAREKAEAALIEDATDVDDLWNDKLAAATGAAPRKKSGSRSKKRRSKWKKRSGLPTWAYRIVSLSVSVIVLLLVAAMIKSVVAKYFPQWPETNATTETMVELPAIPKSNSEPAGDDVQRTVTFDDTESPADASTFPPGNRQPGVGRRGDLSMRDRLWRFDTNEDGRISKAELNVDRFPIAGPLRRLREHFDDFDLVPRDGELDKSEVEKMLAILSRPVPRENRERPQTRPQD